MVSRSRRFLDSAIAAMMGAIECHNRLFSQYRLETFVILAFNSWELLLKARWLQLHHNKEQSLWVEEKGSGKRRKYKKKKSGTPRTHGCLYLAEKLKEQDQLAPECLENLRALGEIRNASVHSVPEGTELWGAVQAVSFAAVRNFFTAVEDWFHRPASKDIHVFLPMTILGPIPESRAVSLSRGGRRLLEYLQDIAGRRADPGTRYSAAIPVEIVLVPQSLEEGVTVRLSTDPAAMPVRLSAEELLGRYPWDYAELTRQCKNRYEGFKVNATYHARRKELRAEPRYATGRCLDPRKEESQKKYFYSPEILEGFDKFYPKRARSEDGQV